MKRTLISLALVAASSAAFAGGASAVTSVTPNTPYPVCDATVSGGGKTTVYGGDGQALPSGTTPQFTQQGFTIQCSANVNMSINEVSTTMAAVGAASVKGNQAFAGTSNGGAIAAVGTCAASGCGASDVSSGIASAISAATSSN